MLRKALGRRGERKISGARACPLFVVYKIGNGQGAAQRSSGQGRTGQNQGGARRPGVMDGQREVGA